MAGSMVSRELVEACRRGEPEAFEELVERTERQVFTLALRLVGDRQDAEDVAQEAYLRVFRGIRGFREEARFETWLYRIVTNAAMTHLSRRGRFGELLMEPDEEEVRDARGESGQDAVALRDEVARALASLSPALRTVVVLKDMYGLSHQEIADELGSTEGAVKVRLHRARKKLKDAIYGVEERARHDA